MNKEDFCEALTLRREIDDEGTVRWYNADGQLHREDGPAIEYSYGTKSWCLNGEYHREDGPAIEWANGAKQWCLNGVLHRADGPALEYNDGTKHWFLNGEEVDPF